MTLLNPSLVAEVIMATTVAATPPSDAASTASFAVASSANTTSDMVSGDGDPDLELLAQIEQVVSIVVPIFFGLLFLVGFLGNLLVVLVVTFNRQMRNTTNLLIMNLAVADILFVALCVPISAFQYAAPHHWPFGDPM